MIGIPLVIRREKRGRIVIKWLPWTTVDIPDKVVKKFVKSFQEVLNDEASEIVLYLYPEIEESEKDAKDQKNDQEDKRRVQ